MIQVIIWIIQTPSNKNKTINRFEKFCILSLKKYGKNLQTRRFSESLVQFFFYVFLRTPQKKTNEYEKPVVFSP